MLRPLNDILGQILIVAFFAVMVITPFVIVVLGIVNLSRDKLRQAGRVVQAVAALAIWGVLSFVIVMVFFMTVFSYPVNSSPSNEIKANAIYITGCLIYFVVGGALIYWTKRQTKRMPSVGISC